MPNSFPFPTTALAAVGALSRNSRCPCGSGRRYKECHGAAGSEGALGAVIARARGALQNEQLAVAREACSEALLLRPEDPQTLVILAQCEQRSGNVAGALPLLLRAIESPVAPTLPAAIQHAHWSELNTFLGYALAGRDRADAIARRSAYIAWLGERATASSPASPLVSIILCVQEPSSDWRSALASIRAQTHGAIEVVLVLHPRARALLPGLEAEAGGNGIIVLVDDEAADIEAMTAAALPSIRGDYVNVLDANHQFAPERIAACVRDIVHAGAAWGYTGAAFTIGSAGQLAPPDDAQARQWSDLLGHVAESYTAGFALVAQGCVAVDVSNLFLRRDLLQQVLAREVAAERPAVRLTAWEWCLYAVLLEEPVRVDAPLYLHRLDAGNDPLRNDRIAFDREVLRIFTDYYAKSEVPGAQRNPWAPTFSTWRWHFLTCVSRKAHIFAVPFASLKSWIGALVQQAALPQEPAQPGITLVGFAYGEFGLGENLRALARACAGDMIPFSIHDVELHLRTRKSDFSMAAYVADSIAHRFALFCFNPDTLGSVPHLLVPRPGIERRNAGYWFWEMEHIPHPWMPLVDAMDEIWVATEFVRAAMQRCTTRPVMTIPTPVEVRLARLYVRHEFGLPDDPFLFLFSFDFEPRPERKNPEAVIRAFKGAFARSRRDVGLVLKSSNGQHQPARLAALHQLIDGDDRIVVIDRILERDAVYGLQSVADCYVSLHRSEGLGLGLAESMAQGKPVIGTRYSGNLDFMHENNSALVDCTLIPVARGDYMYDDPRFRWADPDIDHAASQMRRMVEDDAWRNTIARRGQLEIRTRYSRAATARLIRARLLEIGAL